MARDDDKSPTTEVHRLEAYLRGEASAFEEVERWVRAELRRRYPRLREDLEDLCQAVHGKLIANLRAGRFEGRSDLRAYVVSITHHTAIDRLRELYAQRALTAAWAAEPRALTDNPYGSLESLDEARLLHQLVLSLPPSCRELWRLVLVERLSYDEVARRLAIPPGTVKSRMWHCRRKATQALRRLRRVRGVRPEL